MRKEDPQSKDGYIEDDSKWIASDILELAQDNNIFAYMKGILNGKTDRVSLLYAAEKVFKPNRRDLLENHPPLGGPYDTPLDKDLGYLHRLIAKEIIGDKNIYPTQQKNNSLNTGHACAYITSTLPSRKEGGVYISSHVDTYVFMTNPGERKNQYIVFSNIRETRDGMTQSRFVQDFAKPDLYGHWSGFEMIIPKKPQVTDRANIWTKPE
ncbi:MAG TPA: hypothetical protein VF189_01285 [Patescibacteria group bacterium]